MIVIKVLFFLTSILSKPGKNWAWAKLRFPYKNMVYVPSDVVMGMEC